MVYTMAMIRSSIRHYSII